MMLFDEFRALTPKNNLFPFYTDFIKALDGAIPLEIDQNVGFLTDTIQKSELSRIEDMSRFCRPPFQKTWIEWPGASGQFSATPNREIDKRQDQRGSPRPDRFGCLIEAQDNMGKFDLSFAWSHKGIGLSISPWMVKMDQTATPTPVPSVFTPADESDAKWLQSKLPRLKHEPLSNIVRHNKRAGLIQNPRMSRFVDQIAKRIHHNSPEGCAIRQAWMDDIEGEGGFIEALLIVLNSRNLVSVSEPTDMSKVNKSRRILGRPPLAEFRTVKINLSKVGARKADAAESENRMREHIVRGHFKVRKSGVFWWSPFIRGDATLGSIARKGYEVRP